MRPAAFNGQSFIIFTVSFIMHTKCIQLNYFYKYTIMYSPKIENIFNSMLPIYQHSNYSKLKFMFNIWLHVYLSPLPPPFLNNLWQWISQFMIRTLWKQWQSMTLSPMTVTEKKKILFSLCDYISPALGPEPLTQEPWISQFR